MKRARENRCLTYLKNNDPKKTISKHGIFVRKLVYPIVRKLSGPMTDVEGVLVSSEPLPKGPKLFAVTHTYSREDIAWGITLAGEQSYLLTNAYQELLYTSDGWALWASGIILVDRYDKKNRKASIEKSIRVNKFGGNVMIFPEGTWNMSPNQVVRKLYPGIYKISCKSKVPVIPIGTMMYDDKLYVNRGKALDLITLNEKEALNKLRDSLATLKWDIMEQYGQTTREQLLDNKTPEQYWSNHLEDYISKQKIYEREEENKAHYVDEKDIEFNQIRYSFNRIEARKESAFLFDKRIKGVYR